MNYHLTSYILIAITALFSYQGFRDRIFFHKYKLEVDGILNHKEYQRMVTSGFLHADWTHLIFNMLSLYFFSDVLEKDLGRVGYLTIYFTSLVGGSIFAVLVNRHQPYYSAIGASGAVCGVIFACIALIPGLKLMLFGIPVAIPAWLYGLIFVGYSIYGSRAQNDNIGHEAHLGGALIGCIGAVIYKPEMLEINYLPILISTVPTLVFMYLVLFKPELLDRIRRM